MNLKETHRYDDIINLPHHVSKVHVQMTMAERAAQFSPFAALSGYDEALRETGRLTQARAELDEDEKELLDEKLQALRERMTEQPRTAITYFCPDGRKEGGSYLTAEGHIKKIDDYKKIVIMEDDTRIPVGEIMEIVILE